MAENSELYLYTEVDTGRLCVSNTFAVLLYTMLSFTAVCFLITARQIINNKRNRSPYLDCTKAPSAGGNKTATEECEDDCSSEDSTYDAEI